METRSTRKKRNVTTINRSYINIIIDVILLLLLVALSSAGFIMKYIMPSRYAIRNEDVQSYASEVLGLGRHAWGDIHWVLSVLFIFFLILHIVLHWKMIIAIVKRMLPNNTGRRILWFIVAVITFALLASPFLYML